MARWVRRRDRTGRVLVVANQEPGVLERYGLTREEADRAAWAFDRDGRHEGAAAINRAMREAGGAWPLVARMYDVPPFGLLEEKFYRWFAPRRSAFARFGVTPECESPGSRCVPT